MEIGFYDSLHSTATVFVVGENGGQKVGFIFGSEDYGDGSFDNDWASSFKNKNMTFQLSDEYKKQILEKSRNTSYYQDVLNYFDVNEFEIKNDYLIKDEEIILIKSISRARKINNSKVELNIYGEIIIIPFSNFNKLQKEMIKEVF